MRPVRYHRITLGHIENTAGTTSFWPTFRIITCSLTGAAGTKKNIRGYDECEMEIVENSENVISAHDTRDAIYFHNNRIYFQLFFFSLLTNLCFENMKNLQKKKHKKQTRQTII